jgi:hypothetical protein
VKCRYYIEIVILIVAHAKRKGVLSDVSLLTTCSRVLRTKHSLHFVFKKGNKHTGVLPH